METRIKICVDVEDGIYYSAQYKGWFLWHEISKSFPRFSCGGDTAAIEKAKADIDAFLARKRTIDANAGTIIRYPLYRDD